MAANGLNLVVQQSLLQLMEETLHSHQDMYTAPATSLLETLGAIGAEAASKPHPPHPETIAGHAFHARFYLEASLARLRGEGPADPDWSSSWAVQTVSPGAWDSLRADLETTYTQVMRLIMAVEDWTTPGLLASLVAMLAHSAYHLGAIRQLKDL